MSEVNITEEETRELIREKRESDERDERRDEFEREDSECSCGQKVFIEHDVNSRIRLSCRSDGKRVWYPDEQDEGWCAFRCKSCMEPIRLTAKGAEFSRQNNKVGGCQPTDQHNTSA